jgi:hypothetical protein
MTPRRQWRRARRRSTVNVVVVATLVVIVVAVLVGGLTQVSRQSQGFDANSNRSLAQQGTVVVGQANTTAHQLSRLLSDFPGDNRQTLQSDLDSLSQQAGGESAAAALAAGSAPAGSAAGDLARAFRDRELAVDEVRAAIDGYLGVSPSPPAGAAAEADAPSPTLQAPLNATTATDRITAAGALLASSDRIYDAGRAALRAGAGHARLPASVWVVDPAQWRPGFLAAQVDLMATSPTLTETHSLVVRTVRYDPPVLPTPPGTAAGTAVVSPTSRLGVSAVVANQGSVAEPHAVVQVTLAQIAPPSGSVKTWRGPVRLGASVAVPTAVFVVKPGATYNLAVSVTSPQSQAGAPGSTYQATLRVAPGT